MKRLRYTIFAFSFLIVGGGGKASAEETNLALLSWSAFQCAAFASYAGEAAQQERLFTLGYNAGRRFLEAMQQAPASEQQAMRDQAPIGFLLSLGGPSLDFMLGRVHEGAVDSAFRKIGEQTGNSLDQGLQRVVAGNLFRSHNCALLR